MRLSKLVCCGSFVVAPWLAGCATPSPHGGPLPVRNQHPAQLLVQSMTPHRAAANPHGTTTLRLDAAYSNLWLAGGSGASSFRMDGEYLRSAAGVEVGLGGGFELGFEVPVAHTSGGFLDSFIIDYHELFGFPDQDRTLVPKDQFAIRARQNGSTLWEVEADSLQLLDIPIQLLWSPTGDRSQPGFGYGLRAGVELPTGDDQRGYGNGEVDWSLGALAELRTATATWYGHLQHTFAGTPAPTRAAGLQFADVTAAGLGVELPLTANFAAIVQTAFETSTLRNLPVAETTREQMLLWVGGRWQVGAAVDLEFAFGEDLIANASPDFTAWVGMAWTPGRTAAR